MLRDGGDARVLIGRRPECQVVDDALAGLRAGRSGALVVHGEAGIGKSALLDHARLSATDCQTASSTGIESEMELAFGGLHQLCAPHLQGMDRLPGPQRDALQTAFGLRTGRPPDPFLVGLAVLGLLGDVAEHRPLVCLIDDAQWLDEISAQTFAFVARRLLAERVLLIFALRDPIADHPLAHLPQLELGGLSDDHARELLAHANPSWEDERIAARIVAESHGNPLAILELPRDLGFAELGYQLDRADGRSLVSDLEQGFLRRVRDLPQPTNRLLLIAAADPIGDGPLLRRAAESVGIDVGAAAPPAAEAELATIGAVVRFRHPLVRSIIYRCADPADLRQAHRVLAEATDAEVDPDRRAWHLARATASPDEAVAEALERSAERARARGGMAAAAAFLDRATQLTPDQTRRAGRALAAAQAKYQAGAYDEALGLLDVTDLAQLDDLRRARAELVRGQILFASRSASAGLPPLLSVAKRLERLDPELARETYRDALYAAFTAGDLPGESGLEQVAAAVLTSAPAAHPSHADLLLEGTARLIIESPSAAMPLLLQAVAAFHDQEGSRKQGFGWLPLASRMAHNGWDFDSWTGISTELVERARDTGALSVLPTALLLLLANRAFAGDLEAAAALAAEAAAIGEATGSTYFAHYGALVVAPWRGDAAATHRAIDDVIRDPALSGEGKARTATDWAAAVLNNGLGRYDDAYAAALRGAAHAEEFGLATWSQVELVEAAVRLGELDAAAAAANRIDGLAQASGTDWALGTAASLTAQLSTGQVADRLYREAIGRLERTGVAIQAGRVQLLYGEWLRRAGQRSEARLQLGRAHDRLSRAGADAFAGRAQHEYEATGARVRPAGALPIRSGLTPQESQIARLAAAGLTNPEIGVRLFISPHTVEWHLRKVFDKLGIRSRREIGPLLGDYGSSGRSS